MEWYHVLTIVGVNIALIGAVATLVIWAVNKLDSDIKSISNRMDGQDVKFNSLAQRLDGHAMRIDQLYHMFIDLLKEGKK